MVKFLAYYYHAYPVYGKTIANFKREIADAQAAGIDGFLLGYHGYYSTGVDYRSQLANMFDAAQGSTFQLALAPIAVSSPFSQDDCTLPWSLYRDHPNYLRINGRPVFVPYGGGGQSTDFWVACKAAMAGNPLFLPYYGFASVDPPLSGPTEVEIRNEWAWRELDRFVDGLTHFSTVGDVNAAIAAEAAYVNVAREKGKLVIAGLKPSFWIGRTLGNPPRVYFEGDGGEGIIRQFEGLRALDVDYAVITAWNDLTEGVLTPAPPPRYPTTLNVDALQLPNEGAYRLAKLQIAWSKNGPQLPNDSLFVFYRTHPNAAVPTSDSSPVIRSGTITDSIYVTTFARLPSQLVYNGGVAINVAAGLVTTRIPFATGGQNIRLKRDGITLRNIDGVSIVANPTKYNYFVASFYEGPR